MENKVAHLEMIQRVIARMASNSFLIKRWSVTLVVALFALAAADRNVLFVCLACFPALMFWALDAYFMRQERLFRKLYDRVRGAESIDFSMDTRPFKAEVAGILGVAWSVTLRLFHGTIFAVVILVTVLMVCAERDRTCSKCVGRVAHETRVFQF